MRIIGLSGLDPAQGFKRARFPNLTEREYRVTQGLDSAAVLLDGPDVAFAAAEERFTREKTTGAFPIQAFRACLEHAGIGAGDVDFVAHGFDYAPHRAFFASDEFTLAQYEQTYAPRLQVELLAQHFPGVDWAPRFVAVSHHLAHAASAFYQSGFASALVLVSDGMGEVDSMTVFAARPSGLEVLAKVPAMHSLGVLYSAFTMYLGFQMNLDEYKVMGLAPFGDRRKYYDQVISLFVLRDDGTYAIPMFAKNRTALEKETHRGVLAFLEEQFGPARPEGAEGMDQRFKDIAAAVQAALQTVQLHVLKHFRAQTGLTDLCLAGGVALNCTANGVIKRSRMFRNVFVQPASGDDGSALGAALYVQRTENPDTPPRRIAPPLWGSAFTEDEIRSAIEARATEYRVKRPSTFDALLEDVAGRLELGQILSWFQGRMEFGPRALGCRSIIADPRPHDMRDRVNMKIKKREGFRPFAPAVTAEAAAEYFDLTRGEEATYEHMLFVMPVLPKYRDQLHAITHVDGSARVQTVTREGNERFYDLLVRFGGRTGVPMVLNTSFNVKGQPIVRTPEEAIDTFLRADLDALVIGDYVLSRLV